MGEKTATKVNKFGKAGAPIKDGAYVNRTDIVAVEIKEGVTAIGARAFKGCTELREIRIPESVTEIGVRAFEDCASLESIIIPGSVKAIRGEWWGGAFRGCTALNA